MYKYMYAMHVYNIYKYIYIYIYVCLYIYMYLKYNIYMYIYIYKYIKHIFVYLMSVYVCVCVCVHVCVYQRTTNLNNNFLTVKQEHCICYYISMFNKNNMFLSKAAFSSCFRVKTLWKVQKKTIEEKLVEGPLWANFRLSTVTEFCSIHFPFIYLKSLSTTCALLTFFQRFQNIL